MIRRTVLAAMLIATALTAGCGKDDNPTPAATPAASGPKAGLTLKTLPAGWKYEGWVVIGGTPVSTGTFTNPAAADNAAPFAPANPLPTPAFPGEDFLPDLQGKTVVISIEPSPDDSAGPFTLKPLDATVPTTAVDHTALTMTNKASTFPTGTATISGTTLSLAFTGFDPLGGGFKYEGWAIIGGAPVTTGKFDIVNGLPVPSTFTGITNLSTATTIIITIEPTPDPSPNPADTHVLAGAVSGGTATLTVGHAAALGDTFGTAAGTYILATPSDGTGTAANERGGVWFLNP